MNFHIRVRAGALIIENNSILLIEFNDENGLHYNLPAGGVEPNESVKEAVRREALEEASINIEVGPLAFVYEYAPHLNSNLYGKTHSIGLMFDCKLKGDTKPIMPNNPDPNQTGVKWVSIDELKNIVLYPNIREQIFGYVRHNRNIELIEEQFLGRY
ncbi:NUDIX domain-containing protein [Bacillus sp. 31A1R]|uniref:NUDIX domain-containing protein n=1 Tax=Robertmurraya mangrovi TaxID=3098077 RepID=A0ABU5J101_9BACI|nr:NUDIX domain-containing protein [Bacillus sp. 31A1R]MDZ5473082.1 NUDIX domain-containing protein [Bacillus sp. 31A1R]